MDQTTKRLKRMNTFAQQKFGMQKKKDNKNVD